MFDSVLKEEITGLIEDISFTKNVYILNLSFELIQNVNKITLYLIKRKLKRSILNNEHVEICDNFFGRSITFLAYTDNECDIKTYINEQLEAEHKYTNNIKICCGYHLIELNVEQSSNDTLKLIQQSIRDATLASLIGLKKGLNCYELTKEDYSISPKLLKLEKDLYQSIIRKELSVHFQPQFLTINNELCGFEALCRWKHPELGFINPASFIEIAENTGFIKEIGLFVLNETVRKLAEINKITKLKVTVAINLSPLQILGHNSEIFIQNLIKLSERFEINNSQLKFEITETNLENSFSELKSTIIKLKSIGHKISIDDFGKGYSSLHRIKELDFDEIKIDKAFIDDITSTKGKAVVNLIIQLANTLNLNVVAEGIEDKEQYEILKHMGCNVAQGFLLSKPIPSDKIVDYLTELN